MDGEQHSTKRVHKIRYSPPKYRLYSPSGFLEPYVATFIGRYFVSFSDEQIEVKTINDL